MISLGLIELDVLGALSGGAGAGVAVMTGAAALVASGLVAGARGLLARREARRPDPSAVALEAFEALRAARLRASPAPEAPAGRRARRGRRRQGPADERAARHALLAALEEASATAVLRLAATAPLRGLVAARPHAALLSLQRRRAVRPLTRRLADARSATLGFLARIDEARLRVRAEATAAPSSVAARVGRGEAPWTPPVEAALVELEAAFGRAERSLELLRRELVGAHPSGDGEGDPLPRGPGASVRLAAARAALLSASDDVARADESLGAAVALLGPAQARRLARAVQRGAAAATRTRGGGKALARALRAVQRELER